jgi:hypothetical protein
MDAVGAEEDESTEGPPKFELAAYARTVDPEGDLCLYVKNSSNGSPFRYRVSSTKLQQASRYFENILDPGRFREGISLAKTLHNSSLNRSSDSDQAQLLNGQASSESAILPVLCIQDVDTPTVSSAEDVLFYFFRYIHGYHQHDWLMKQKFRFIFSLACVADRFFSHDCIRPAMRAVHSSRQHGLKQKSNLHREGISHEQEAAWRQRIIVGLWYSFEDWVQYYSHLMIIYGSHNWIEGPRSPGNHLTSHALWDEIPEGIEGESCHQDAGQSDVN